MVWRIILAVALAVAGFVLLLVGEAVLARLTLPDDGYVPPSDAPRTFGEGGERLSLVVLGDSTAAGRGAEYEAGIAVGAARDLAADGRRVVLTNLAVSGATFADVRSEQLGAAVRAEPDVVLISCGANDVTGLRSAGAIRDDLLAIVERLRMRDPDLPVVVTGSPDMGSVPRLAQPLRAVVGWRAGEVNDALEDILRDQRLVLAPIAARTGPAFRRDRSLFAADGYHPSAAGYAIWRPVIREALAEALRG